MYVMSIEIMDAITHNNFAFVWVWLLYKLHYTNFEDDCHVIK